MCCEHEDTNVFSIYNTCGMVGEVGREAGQGGTRRKYPENANTEGRSNKAERWSGAVWTPKPYAYNVYIVGINECTAEER